MKQAFHKIEFWIIVFFLIRLVGITNPPLEISHNWRQVTGLMVSRNFLEVDPNILFPRVDYNGEDGIVGMEFPVLNYLHFLVSLIFGYNHWYGRLINLIISSFGLLFFYKLIPYLGLSKKAAFISTIFLAGSLWFSFSRKMMPDTFCISLSFIGLYFGLRFLEKRTVRNILLFTIFSSLAVLSKIPAGIFIIPVYLLLFSKKIKLPARVLIAFASLIPFSLAYYWYFIWNPHLSHEFGNWYNIGRSLETGYNEIVSNMNKTLENFYFDSFSSYFTFSLFIIGLAVMIIKKEKRLIILFFVIFATFLIYIFKSGYFFYHHDYYIIPFVPVMALVAGYAVSLVKKKWIYIALMIIGVGEGIANQQHDFFIPRPRLYKMSLEGMMDEISEKDDLILVNGNGNPQLLYLSHRKGWICTNHALRDESYILDKISDGCMFIVIDRHIIDEIDLPYKVAFLNDDFLIYAIPATSLRTTLFTPLFTNRKRTLINEISPNASCHITY